MDQEAVSGSDWSDWEIDLIVADYFDMLGMELRNEPFVKAQRNTALQEATRRSRGSIEFKHQNISAVFLQLGMPWIRGYKPMANFQKALLDGIERYLDGKDRAAIDPIEVLPHKGLAESPAIFFGPPPQLTPSNDALPDTVRRLVRKFDPAARDARNRQLGRLGEEAILKNEIDGLREAGRDDLAKRVRWISQEDGDGAGYDILSFDHVGNERLLEVKTTRGGALTPFYISENERSFAEERADSFRLVRLYDFARQPSAFELEPPLTDHVKLAGVSFRASFG